MNPISTQPANQPGLVNLSMFSLKLFSFPLDNAVVGSMLCKNLPRPVNGSRWPTAGSEPSNGDKQLQNREPRPDSYF